jgi:hypothetical protein
MHIYKTKERIKIKFEKHELPTPGVTVLHVWR